MAIGYQAGETFQPSNSIVLNATGASVNRKPVRSAKYIIIPVLESSYTKNKILTIIYLTLLR
jgi:hypothetical protein